MSGVPPSATAHEPGREHRRLVAVAFGPPTMVEALAGLERLADQADLIELRLDLFEQPYDLPLLLRERRCPVVVTLRARHQGGRCDDLPDDRLAVLVRAAELGAEYVDLEWDAAIPDRVAALQAAGARVIVSRHDFEQMPPELAGGWWSELAALGGDVVKVVGTARDVRDCLEIFRAFRRADRPTIAIAMGEAGRPSRVLALRETWCLLSYAAANGREAVAPGQVAVSEMRTVYRAGRLGPATAAFGLLAPSGPAADAAAYNGWFADSGLDAVAVPFTASDDAPGIISAFRELPIAGWQVDGAALQTTVGQALDSLDRAACRAGKVNAIVARGEALMGTWRESARDRFAYWTEREPTS